MRIGRIGYINCAPVYSAIDRGIVSLPTGAELVTGTPSELNDLLVAGELDLSVISAVEYARHAKELVLLPDLAISCDGPVRSVALFSRRPVGQLDGRTVLLSASSRTSVALLELLCRDVWKIKPRFADARAEAHHLEELAAAAAQTTGVSLTACRAYLSGLDYALSSKRLAGLTDFFRRLAALGLVPDGSLQFVQVA